jgi:hypothetical protein
MTVARCCPPTRIQREIESASEMRSLPQQDPRSVRYLNSLRSLSVKLLRSWVTKKSRSLFVSNCIGGSYIRPRALALSQFSPFKRAILAHGRSSRPNQGYILLRQVRSSISSHSAKARRSGDRHLQVPSVQGDTSLLGRALWLFRLDGHGALKLARSGHDYCAS